MAPFRKGVDELEEDSALWSSFRASSFPHARMEFFATYRVKKTVLLFMSFETALM